MNKFKMNDLVKITNKKSIAYNKIGNILCKNENNNYIVKIGEYGLILKIEVLESELAECNKLKTFI